MIEAAERQRELNARKAAAFDWLEDQADAGRTPCIDRRFGWYRLFWALVETPRFVVAAKQPSLLEAVEAAMEGR